MNNEITKQEILAYTDAQNRTAIALERIVERLSDMTINQSKILEKLSNGISKDVTAILNGCTACRTDIDTIKNKTNWITITLGGLLGVVALGLVIVEIVHKFMN